MNAVLVDAGPLVALLDAADQHHPECASTFKALRDPLLTVWPAFTEAMHLLHFSSDAQDALWELLESESLALATLDRADAPRMQALMRKYRDLPMDLADAGLIRVAEREKLSRIFTLDRRHFRVYRASGVGKLSILPA